MKTSGPVEQAAFRPIQSQSNPVQMLFGTLLLFFGWFGFNGGSMLAVSEDQDLAVARIMFAVQFAPSSKLARFRCERAMKNLLRTHAHVCCCSL